MNSTGPLPASTPLTVPWLSCCPNARLLHNPRTVWLGWYHGTIFVIITVTCVTWLNWNCFPFLFFFTFFFLIIFFTTRLSSRRPFHLVLSTRKSLQWWNRLREPWPTAGHDLTRLDSWPDDQLVELNYWISCYDMCARAASHCIIAVARTHLRLSVPLHPLKRLAILFSQWEFSDTRS